MLGTTLGAMQDWPLLISRLLDHAATNHGGREIVSLTVEGPLHRTDWRTTGERARKVAGGLRALGIGEGDRVATLAWNTHRHLECWYGISGMGAVAHTINPRLFHEQIAYIANHAGDRVLFFDLSFLAMVETLAPAMPTIAHYVAMTDRAHMPQSALPLLCYEELVEAGEAIAWPLLDERAPAGLCYTSGTTGNPKGVLYSHRSNVLHAWAGSQADALGLSARAVVLPVVPMFHANAWGVPYAAALTGAKLVMAGPHSDPATLQRLIADEAVTFTLGVPTIWLAMLQHLEATGGTLAPLERIMIGGSAAPRALIERLERDFHVEVRHAWGSTEMSPIGTVGSLCAGALAEPAERQLDLKCKQGRPPFGVEMRIVDDDGCEAPRDGAAFGHLQVRGPWVIARYFGGDGGAILDADGWFDTGDIATIDPLGYMQITDRAKDVIKSGGEWISSIELENAAIGCAGVAEAAVIGLPHPRWGERPLLVIVRAPGSAVDEAAIRAHLAARVAKWWLPDVIAFIEAIPHTATGKIQKTALRERFRDLRLGADA